MDYKPATYVDYITAFVRMRPSNTATLPADRIASTGGADVCRRSLDFLMKSQAKPRRQTEATQRQKNTVR